MKVTSLQNYLEKGALETCAENLGAAKGLDY